MILGVVAVAAALCLTVYNLWDNLRAYKDVDSILGKISDEQDVAKTIDDMPVVTIDGFDYIGTLKIPEINKELPVMKDWDYDRLRISPCRYAGSVYTHDFVIAGHNYRVHLGPISNLEPGDDVYFIDAAGKEYKYKVEKLETLKKTAVEEMKSGGWDLTLFTCTLSGNARVTVRCSLSEE